MINEKKLINTFSAVNKKLYDRAKNPLKCHNTWHHFRVCKNALKLATDLHLDYDPEILIPACFLHDISAYFPASNREEHHVISSRLAKIELEQLNYPKGKITKITETISSHGTDHKPKDKREATEATLLRDADKIETSGPLGVARIIMAETRRGKSIEEIADKWLGRIDKKVQAITYPETKKLSFKDFKYTKDFFKSLKKQIEKGQP